jgi:hypothetical protein
MAAILINIEISLVNEQFMDQGKTLSDTLLPYINNTSDFAFLTSKSDFIVGRFLNALIQHIKDSQL